MELLSCPWSEEHGDARPSQLQLLDLVRTGGIFSEIYRCKNVETGKQYLVKKVQLRNLQDKDLRYRLREVDIWKQLRHPNILTCHYGWQTHGSELWILSETARHSVEQLLSFKGCAPPQKLFEKWLYQMALALQYLHEDRATPVLHRNLKPSNIMVVDHYTLKLSDFGVCRELRGKDEMAMSQVGSGRTMSPEMLKNLPYDSKTDMWSLGIAVVYIATLHEAVQEGTFDTLFRKVKAGQVRGIGGHYDRKSQAILNSLLQVDPNQRPSASELITRLRSDFPNCARPSSGDRSGVVAAVDDDDDGSDAWQSRSGSTTQQEWLTLSDDDSDILILDENRRDKSRLSNQRRGANSRNPKPRNAWVSSDSGSHFPTEEAGSSPPELKSRPLANRRSEQRLDSSSTKEKKKHSANIAGRPSSFSKTAPPGGPRAVVREIPEPAELPLSSAGSGRRRSVGRQFSPNVSNLCLVLLSMVVDEEGSSPSATPSRRSSAEGQSRVVVKVVRSSTARPSSPSWRTPRRMTVPRPVPLTPVRGNVDRASSTELQQHKHNSDEVSNRSKKYHRETNSSRSAMMRRYSDGPTSSAATSSREARSNTRASIHVPNEQPSRSLAKSTRFSDSGRDDKCDLAPVTADRFTTPEDDDDDDDVMRTSEEEEEYPLINTFPGAFNVQKYSPQESFERHQHKTLPPDLAKGAAKKGKTTTEQHCPQPQDARVLGAAAAASDADAGSDADGNPRADFSSAVHVSATDWSTSLQRYWSIARNLASKLGADVLLTALNIARLFSRKEVMMWLHEKRGESGRACIDDILTLIELNNQLDIETRFSLHRSLLHAEDAGSSGNSCA